MELAVSVGMGAVQVVLDRISVCTDQSASFQEAKEGVEIYKEARANREVVNPQAIARRMCYLVFNALATEHNNTTKTLKLDELLALQAQPRCQIKLAKEKKKPHLQARRR